MPPPLLPLQGPVLSEEGRHVSRIFENVTETSMMLGGSFVGVLVKAETAILFDNMDLGLDNCEAFSSGY